MPSLAKLNENWIKNKVAYIEKMVRLGKSCWGESSLNKHDWGNTSTLSSKTNMLAYGLLKKYYCAGDCNLCKYID